MPSQQEYWTEVKEIADRFNSKEQFQNDYGDMDRYDALHQAIDGHYFIIYNNHARDVVYHSDNSDAWRDYGMELEYGDHPPAAYAAMLQDVSERLEEWEDDDDDDDDDDEWENPPRITNADIEGLVHQINVRAGQNTEGWTQDASGRYRANVGTYVIDSAYGGVSLSQLVNESGGERTIIGRGTKRELYNAMRAYLAGMARENFPEQEHRDLMENWGEAMDRNFRAEKLAQEKGWTRSAADARKAGMQALGHYEANKAATRGSRTAFDDSMRLARASSRYAEGLENDARSNPAHVASHRNPARQRGARIDGKWFRQQIASGGDNPGYVLRGTVDQGHAWIIAYKPRKHPYARVIAATYERDRGRKVPKGTKWLLSYRKPPGEIQIFAHKTLASAKKAGAKMVGVVSRQNPAKKRTTSAHVKMRPKKGAKTVKVKLPKGAHPTKHGKYVLHKSVSLSGGKLKVLKSWTVSTKDGEGVKRFGKKQAATKWLKAHGGK